MLSVHQASLSVWVVPDSVFWKVTGVDQAQVKVLVMYSVLMAHFHKIEQKQGRWVLGSHLVLCWRYSLIYMVSKGGYNTLDSATSFLCIFMNCKQHKE